MGRVLMDKVWRRERMDISKILGGQLSFCEDMEFLRWHNGGEMGVADLYGKVLGEFKNLFEVLDASTSKKLDRIELEDRFPVLMVVSSVEWGKLLSDFGYAMFPPFGTKGLSGSGAEKIFKCWGIDGYFDSLEGQKKDLGFRILIDLQLVVDLWGNLSLDDLLLRMVQVFQNSLVVCENELLDDLMKRYRFLRLLQEKELEKVLVSLGFVVEKVPQYFIRDISVKPESSRLPFRTPWKGRKISEKELEKELEKEDEI